MGKTKEQKAITLIALIITIVVLLILAVVAINAVTGDGIIQHATNAKKEYQEAQDKEEDMLAYYEGVLQSGEVVPTVEQLQEKYTFSYFSSLKRAIENVNGTANNEADSNLENAVAGIYEDDGNKYVVLMKDTQENSVLSATSDMTLNLGGKTLSFTADKAYLNFETDNTKVTIDGRIGGSTIQKNIENGTSYGIINSSNGNSLIINSGKYLMKGKYYSASANTNLIKTVSSKKVNIKNAQITMNNDLEENCGNCNRAVNLNVTDEGIINNCIIKVAVKSVWADAVRCAAGEGYEINNSYISCISEGYTSAGVYNKGKLTISNTEINADSIVPCAGIYNVDGGILKFNSGTVKATYDALYCEGSAEENYIYGGTFSGYAWGGINIKSTGRKNIYRKYNNRKWKVLWKIRYFYNTDST